MSDEQERDDDQMVGHSSTTIPGGEKDLSGDPGRTPGKAEGEEDESAEARP